MPLSSDEMMIDDVGDECRNLIIDAHALRPIAKHTPRAVGSLVEQAETELKEGL